MYMNSGIRNLIIKWDFVQISNAIETGSEEGMITMRRYAESLRDQWIVDEKEYRGYFLSDTNSNS
jgi:Tfp pilus assembly pilus retraction ATPase PilT